LYFGRFAVVHIGGPSSNQAASLESQPIHQIQLLFGRTLKEAFLHASQANSNLSQQAFHDQVRDRIADGTLRASGFRFLEFFDPARKTRTPSSGRVDIPSIAMADYFLSWAECIFMREVVRDDGLETFDGWDDVRLRADDVDRLWPRVGIGSTLANEVMVEPLFGDSLELSEEVELGVLASVTPFAQNKVGCQLIQD
jgi:hypothetical protein